MPFQFSGIDPAPFRPLFELDDAQLQELHAIRCTATADTGYPCRVSLADARTGDALLLIAYVHQPESSPFRASGPIFVRRDATRQTFAPDVVPPYLATRRLSLRAYDVAGRMTDATLCEGSETDAALRRLFAQPSVTQVQVHNAMRGCFLCAADRT